MGWWRKVGDGGSSVLGRWKLMHNGIEIDICFQEVREDGHGCTTASGLEWIGVDLGNQVDHSCNTGER